MAEVVHSVWTREQVVEKIDDLIAFVGTLEQGAYYAGAIRKLIGPPSFAGAISLHGPDSETKRRSEERRAATINKVLAGSHEVEQLVIELTRYQPWEFPKKPNDR